MMDRLKTAFLMLWPVLSLLLLCLIAGQPLLSGAVGGGFDVSVHFWRAVEAGRLLRAGVVWPRWAPMLAWGYGSPLFIFQGTLSSQIAAGFNLMGLDWTAAINAAYLVGLCGSTLALYAVAREVWGRSGGLSAAVVFLFTPFHLYVTYYRASLSESVAWIFPPLVLWGMTRWSAGRRSGLATGVLALAALAASHPVSFFLFAPPIAAWAAAECLGAEREARRMVIRRLLLFLALGGAISAAIWGPGLAERGFVQLERSTQAWVFTYQANFLPLEQLFALPRHADPLLLNDWPARGVGLLPVLLALAGMLTWRRWERAGQARLALLAATALLCLGLSMALSRPVWDAIPALGAFQFPWRFLGPAALALALMAGAGAQWLTERRNGVYATALLTAAMAVAHWGWLYPPQGVTPGDGSPGAYLTWEEATELIGTTASGELAPRWVRQSPDWKTPVRADFAAKGEAARLDPESLPPGARVIAAEYLPLEGRLTLETPQAFTARWRAFYYPGWRVEVDGQAVAVAPEPQTGVITFTAPAGRHTVRVAFGETPLRLALDGLALIGLVTLAVVAWCGDAPQPSPPAPPTTPSAAEKPWLWLGLAAALLLSKVLVVDRIPTPLRYTHLRSDGLLTGVELPQAVNFGGWAQLLGVELPPPVFAADAAPQMAFYWRALIPTAGDWRMGAALVDASGVRRTPDGLRDTRWERAPQPMASWPPETYARMAYHLDVLPGTPPGVYTFTISLFDRQTLQPVSVLGADGNPIAPELMLGTVELTRPSRPATLDELRITAGVTPKICGSLELWELRADRSQAAPGEMVTLRLIWEATKKPEDKILAILELQDATGGSMHTWETPLAGAAWPTDRWQAGDRWVGQPQVRLPGSLESGEYRLSVGLPGCPALTELPLTVTAPARVWTVPAAMTPLAVELGGLAQLAGYTLTPPAAQVGEAVQVQLAWQARAEIPQAYRVFVHLVGPDGALVAQSDAEPSGWTRPTTGWAVGEVVLDEHRLTLPAAAAPGEYEVRVGLYLLNGPRLRDAQGQDYVRVAVLRVTP